MTLRNTQNCTFCCYLSKHGLCENMLPAISAKIQQFGFSAITVSSLWVLSEGLAPSYRDQQHYFHPSNLLQQLQFG